MQGSQVKVPPGSKCFVGQQELELQHFHFHAPSEHALDGRRTAMEAHLVHRDVRTGTPFTVLQIWMQKSDGHVNNASAGHNHVSLAMNNVQAFTALLLLTTARWAFCCCLGQADHALENMLHADPA